MTESTDVIAGEILGHGKSFTQVRVRLENGEDIIAVLSKSSLRKIGCWFGTFIGWKVRVVLRPPPKMPRIIDLERPTPDRAT